MKDTQKIHCQIDFQDFFTKDFVELNLNGCSIFSDTLTSDKSDGLTNTRLNVYKRGKIGYLVKFNGKTIECDAENQELNLIIILNGHQNKFMVHLTKGKYLGISKKNISEVYIHQSKAPFVYD